MLEVSSKSLKVFLKESRSKSTHFCLTEEQIDIRKSEIVCQQLSEHKLSGPYVVLIAHSHREYRGTMIKAENFEGFKEDTEAMKRWPLRAWTDSAYNETQYVLLDIPKLGTHPVAIVTLKDENVINLRFPVLSSDRNSKFLLQTYSSL